MAEKGESLDGSQQTIVLEGEGIIGTRRFPVRLRWKTGRYRGAGRRRCVIRDTLGRHASRVHNVHVDICRDHRGLRSHEGRKSKSQRNEEHNERQGNECELQILGDVLV